MKRCYYHKEFGYYTIIAAWKRLDYGKKEALIVTDCGLWHRVPYQWLLATSRPVDRRRKP